MFKFETEFLEEMLKRYGSRKALIVLAGVGAILYVPMPEGLTPVMQGAVVIAKVVCVALLGGIGVFAQWKLDRKTPSVNEHTCQYCNAPLDATILTGIYECPKCIENFSDGRHIKDFKLDKPSL